MSFIDDILADDAAYILNPDLTPGCEPITISADGTTERTVYALVDRSPPASHDGGGKMRSPKLRVTLANHATLGISLSALNTGKSYIKVATDKGGTPKKEPLMGKPTSQDAGLLSFEW